MNQEPLVAVGLIIYGRDTRQYLPQFINSWRRQIFANWRLLVWDNAEGDPDDNWQWLRERCPEAKMDRSGRNLGFAAAYNKLLTAAKKMGADYFVVTNADTFWTEQSLALLVAALNKDPGLGSVSPKIRRWDFNPGRFSDYLDSCGLRVLPGLRFVDLGQGQLDRGQFDQAKILGPSGAAGLFRLTALEQVRQAGEQYFDEKFFMYKEDCDLAYRLRLAGWTSELVSRAVVYHDRTVAGGNWRRRWQNRARRRRAEKIWSFTNQWRLVTKHWSRQSLIDKFFIVGRVAAGWLYALIFEPYLLRALFKRQ